jgi:hypothetical protein
MQDEQAGSFKDNAPFEADIILPSQYFESVGSHQLSGEQRLMLAVLVDAVNVLHSWKGTGSALKRRNFAEAVQWINSQGNHYPFSFDNVCDALGIEAGLLRSRLRVLTARPANAAGRPTWELLRIKELSRGQHMTPHRSPRRKRVRRNPKSNGLHTLEPTGVGRHADCISVASQNNVLVSEPLARVPLTESM